MAATVSGGGRGCWSDIGRFSFGARVCQRAEFGRVPGFKTRYGVSQDGQLDVGINGVNVTTPAMPHEFLAYVRDHPDLDESRVEGMAEIMEAVVRNTCAANGRRPAGLQIAEGCSLIGEEQSRWFPKLGQEFKGPIRERNLPHLAF